MQPTATETKEIGFSYNWNNKLSCAAFTTIRLDNPAKYQVGETYDILLNKKKFMEGKIIAIRNFYLRDMNDFIAYLDTGYSKEECGEVIKKMYKGLDLTKKLLSLILIQRVVKK